MEMEMEMRRDTPRVEHSFFNPLLLVATVSLGEGVRLRLVFSSPSKDQVPGASPLKRPQ